MPRRSLLLDLPIEGGACFRQGPLLLHYFQFIAVDVQNLVQIPNARRVITALYPSHVVGTHACLFRRHLLRQARFFSEVSEDLRPLIISHCHRIKKGGITLPSPRLKLVLVASVCRYLGRTRKYKSQFKG